MSRLILIRAVLCTGTIALGLGLRRFGYDVGLPFGVVKYGGSILWGMMVFFLAGMVFPARRRLVIAAVALAIAIIVEVSRLYHTPMLDAFRLTTAGALLLGRVFSLWNIVAYAVGIVLGVAADAAVNGAAKNIH
jgi:hypothetical protein